MKVALEDVEQLLALRRRINEAKLEDIEWTRGGKGTFVDPIDVANWRFVGLSNFGFAEQMLGIGPNITTLSVSRATAAEAERTGSGP